MILELYAPPPPLGAYVEMFTFYEDYNPGYSVERLLPEGVIEIIIDLTETPKFIFDNDKLTEIQSCRTAWVSGMRNRFITISAGGPHSSMFVIRFRRGMAYPFLQMPLQELNYQVVDADLIFCRELNDLRDQLLAAPTPQAKFALAEHYLLQRAKGHLEDIPPVIRFAIQCISQHPATIVISDMVQKIGYSHKHFLALFSKYVGLTPKQFLRLMRFQSIIYNLEQMNEIEWSRVAYESGYYDQAHFINDFRAFSGFSPLEYMNAKGEIVNYIPIR
ncbi:MAG: AraC family transcriptional regulator [Saprospiraceae bacterium]|nr:AraC family transcriptional regulator [Saprospiraceae bacterium]